MPTRTPLNRGRVLRAAIEIADRGGLDGLTMRGLGRALGVEAMSLYNHVQRKDDLLDAMVDVVFSEIALPSPGRHWRTAMRERAISTRQALLKHPWAIGLMESRRRPGPANLQHHDAVLATLRKAGFSVEMAGHAYAVLDGYIYGFTLTELNLPLENQEAIEKMAEAIIDPSGPARYPYLAEMATAYAKNPRYRYGDEFEYGLDLILDGIGRMKDSETA